MDRVPLSEADGHMAELVGRVENGEEIVILRDGKPAARLVPIGQAGGDVDAPRSRRLGLAKGKIWVADDFDETPDWMIDAFHGIDADQPFPEPEAHDVEAIKAHRAKTGS
ncbi:type II toxin-antitoxin system prevent-host-death family antitoxin [Azospirillum cavernae]|uniref:Antitoxin n=1 Tax=Azospirillum cavernae TaxID=2320860 RepID=A0A418VWI5_9PROT|nr:type II toxin-antitoxin system prevent-host-death family antitoxin [Azospirillum cavernae]RJF81516.1 type II toxin-antitoxin system prevent-host-death family antitoxin [Azospirillum cavernae]